MRNRATALLFLFSLAVSAATAQPLHDPALHFSTIRTPHFVVYFHQGETAIAERLGGIAEQTWDRLAGRLGPAPPPLTHLVLVDETELANGSAYPLPRDTVVVTAAWPAGSEFIGNTDDWLRLVFTHEFTHIVHLDRSESWARIVRSVFGRIALAYPNLFLPTWQIEGLATFEESAITGEGRLHAGDFRQIVDAAARARGLEPMDRVNGGLTDWPSGLGAYAYGLGFHEYLAERFGADRFRELANRTARTIPFTGSRVFRQVYGESLGDLWREYEASLNSAGSAGDESHSGAPARLTHHGFYVSGPRFAEGAIVYSVRTPHELPSLNRVAAGGGRPERLATRYLGSTVGIGHGIAYFDQQELRSNAGLYSDLYSIDLATRRVRRLTEDARLIDPDLSPDGRTLVAVRDRPGGRDLVSIALAPDGTCGAIETIASGAETQFNAPRWSPDSRSIAVERHVPGSPSDVVVVDLSTRAITSVLARPASRVVTPAWMPGSGRIVVAAAPEDAPFQLFEIELGSRQWRQLTDVAGGALWPDVSPDGRMIVFVGYTVDGFDLFTMSSDTGFGTRDVRFDGRESTSDQRGADPVPAIGRSLPMPDPGSPVTAPAATYAPWPTLLPTSWTPVFSGDRHSVRAGAGTGGVDVLGYHAWAATATWLLTSPAGAPLVPAATPDWQVAYAYSRWRPTFYVSASTDTSFFAGPATDAGTPSEATLRERELQAGVLLPIRHVRIAHRALAAIVRATDEYTFADGTGTLTRAALRGGWWTSTAHLFGYSISPERGISAAATIERVDPSLGSSGQADATTGDVRAYLPGFAAHHVAALRIAGGTSTGDPALRRTFHLGGAGPNSDPLDFGSNAVSVLRGFPIDTFAGRNVALLNADYRFPIARIERGVGTWPLFLHTLHAAVFADAGHTWTRTFRMTDAKTAIGAELAADLIAGYGLPFTTVAGVAYGRDGSGRVANGTTIYVRVGRAF